MSPGRAVWHKGSAAVARDGNGVPTERRGAGGGTGAPEQGGEIPNVQSVAAFLAGWTLIWFYLAKSWETLRSHSLFTHAVSLYCIFIFIAYFVLIINKLLLPETVLAY